VTVIIYGDLFVSNTYQSVTRRHSKQMLSVGPSGAEQAHGQRPIIPYDESPPHEQHESYTVFFFSVKEYTDAFQVLTKRQGNVLAVCWH
jgi:hypothetical protein